MSWTIYVCGTIYTKQPSVLATALRDRCGSSTARAVERLIEKHGRTSEAANPPFAVRLDRVLP